MDTRLIWVFIMCSVLWQNIHGNNLERRRRIKSRWHRSDCGNTCNGCFTGGDGQLQISCGVKKFNPFQCGSVQEAIDKIPSKYKCHKKQSSEEDDKEDDRKKRSTDCKHTCKVCFINNSKVKIVCGEHTFFCQYEDSYKSITEHMCPDSRSTLSETTTTTRDYSNEDIHEESDLNTENNYTALYVMMVLIFVAFSVMITFFAWRRHKSQINITRDDSNVLVMESSSTVPTSGRQEMLNDAEYSEIPADAIYSDKTGNTSNVSAVKAYDHLRNQANLPIDNYSHLITSRKLDHTDNTYNHIVNTSGSQQKQKPSDESDDAYNKIQKMPTNEPGNKSGAIKNLDPDYNHLKINQKSNVNKECNNTDNYSHIGQSHEQKGKDADTNISTVHVQKEASVDKTGHQSTDDFKDNGMSVAATPVFMLEQDKKDDDETQTGRHYFVLEKHDKETDSMSGGVPDYEVPVVHEYFVLKKQDETMS